MISRRALLAAALLAPALWAAPASAQKLDASERDRLLGGQVVRRSVDLETGDGDYFGGVAYVIVERPPAEVMEACLEVRAFRKILPLTLEAREVGRHGDNRLVFLKQGGRLGTASYTLIVRRESPSLARFWVDPTLPHEIEDGWGYLRVDPFGPGRTLVTYAVLLRVEGLFKLLFKEKIRSFALDTPLYIRRYVGSGAR